MELLSNKKKEIIGGNKMKKTSTIIYAFEDKFSNLETFSPSEFENMIDDEKIIGSIYLELENENESIQSPLLKGYKKPYDWAVTDEIGTEHYVYYEEIGLD